MSEVEQVRAVSAAYLQAVKEGDADKAAALFSEDGVMMPPNAPLIEGREAIRQTLLKNGPLPTLNEEFLMFEVSGRLAYQRSRASWVSNGKTKYTDSMDVLKQTSGGTWQYAAMVWNSSEGFDES
jgi:ketosteroid isomerase-like protein